MCIHIYIYIYAYACIYEYLRYTFGYLPLAKPYCSNLGPSLPQELA